jgi:hypothetical protein
VYVEAGQEVTLCREHDAARRLAGYGPSLPTPENVPKGTESPQMGSPATDKKSAVTGEAKENSPKLTDRRGNLYENKGPPWKSWPRSWNVYENTGT